VTVEHNGTPITTPEMSALGTRLKSGTVTLDDLRLADRLIRRSDGHRTLPRNDTTQEPV
jgi:hypothetical protein